MKKTILFTIDSLDCAGAEKSLVTLLSILDYEKYSVDLMLFAHGKLLEEFLPKEVNVLNPLRYTKFASLSLTNSFIQSIKQNHFDLLFSRLKYSFSLRKKNYRNSQEANLFWKCASSVIESPPKKYDIAISYSQGVPTFYVAEKVTAKRKFTWVNESLRLDEEEKSYQKKFYDKYNRIVAVSDSAKEVFIKTFPFYSNKIEVIYDIYDANFIIHMAEKEKGYNDNYDGIKILTIGRFDTQKGYDITLKACKELKDKGIKFKWYVLGKGPLKEEILQTIIEYKLSNHFILLGVKANPYPYIKNADIYVQTSRTEGFGLAIAEARMLNVPVVTTRFDAVFNQMIDGKNGLVVDMNPEAVTKGILKVIQDQQLKEDIIKYLQSEKKGNVEEIDRFYNLIG